MNLEQYVIKLENLSNNLPKIVDNVLKENESKIVGMLKFRLFNFGTDGNYDPLKEYTAKTKSIKAKENQKKNITTLRDTGMFYKGFYITPENGLLFASSRDYKTEALVNKYGEAIFDFTPKQQDDIVKNIIEPEIQSIIDSLGDISFVI